MSKYPVGPGKKKKAIPEKPGEKNSGEDLVLTPGGPRPRKLVKVVRPGQAVRGTDAGPCIVPSSDTDTTHTKEKKKLE